MRVKMPSKNDVVGWGCIGGLFLMGAGVVTSVLFTIYYLMLRTALKLGLL